MKELDPRKCEACTNEFTPKPGGYNAKYCSKACKVRKKRERNPEPFRKRSARSYERIKADPERNAKRLEQDRKQRKKIRGWLAEYKQSRGCIDCGYDLHPAALQIDHNGPKEASISEMRTSIARMEKEIKNGNCEVRCANCHSVKTWAEKNNLPYPLEDSNEHK